MTRAFYDGEGRLVETRAPGPGSQDIVTFAYYDLAGRQIFKSNPYFVTAYTGLSGPAAYSIPDSTQPGSSTTYVNLRQTSVTDPNSHITTSTDSVVCGVAGTNDTGCYGQTLVQNANGHQAASLTGGLGKTNYKQTYTGTSTYVLYATTTMTYNAAGDLLSTKSPDGTTVTTTYDGLGHATSQNDPDSGTSTATYDPNGNVTQTVDARGSAGTIDAGYDGLNRQLWRNGTNSPTNALVTYSYDSTANGNHGVGQLTSENFTGSGNLSGSYAYTYDARGQQTQNVETINGIGYTTQGTYNDAGQLLSQTYPTGETVTPGYSSTGWLTGLATSAAGNTTLASNLTYSGLAGAAGKISSMSLGNGTSTYAASYDTGMRLTSAGLSNVSNGTQLYQTQPTYDAVNNVVGVQTSVGGQTDTQQFCYDDLSRLTWSGTNGTPPCSGSSITAGTLTAAQYQQSESYNVDGGLVSGPAGSYNYGDSAHPHAVTSTSNGYSATYDAAGNLLCRALTTTTTCSGASPSGQQLSYDAQGRLSLWQDQASAPTQTVNYLYDGSGSRVATQSTANGTTTLTSYIGSLEEVQTTGSSTQTTTYYAVEGKRIAADVNGTFYYFGYDALGSQVAVLNSTGSLVGAQLYGPYGSSRYNTGTLPTSIGFTGQRADSVTGLDYYNARYYDPGVGQFLSVDSVQGNAVGMDPYAYVGGNPESRTDPSGNMHTCSDIAAGCEGQSGSGSTPTSGCGPCHDPNKPWPVSGGGTTTTPRPTPTATPVRSSPGGGGNPSTGCDARCGTDKILIKNHYTKEKAKTQSIWDAIGDGVSLVGDFLALAADWGNDWADFFFTAVTSLLPHLLALVVDITKASGGMPPRWLSDISGYAKVVVAFLNGLRPILRYLNPTEGILGTIKDWIVHETKHALTEAIGLAIGGAGAPGVSAFSKQALEDKYNDINNQVDGYSAAYAYQQCQLFYAHQNVQC